MLMYNPVTPMLMLVPLIEVLEGMNGERCARFGRWGDVRREIFEMITDVGLPCFDCCRGGCGVFRSVS